jgi:hypothetical protein
MWYGRRKHNWQFATMCDYGRPGRRTILIRHYSAEAARKSWKRIQRWYGPRATYLQHKAYRVWQVTSTGVVINDTGVYGHRDYSDYEYADNVNLYAS